MIDTSALLAYFDRNEPLHDSVVEVINGSMEPLVISPYIVDRYADQSIGVADASNLVLAEAYRTSTIATLDRRRFSVLRLSDGTAPTIVP